MHTSRLPIDDLSAAEMRALDFGRQVDALNDLFVELKRLSDLRMQALDLRADARMRLCHEPRDPELRAREIDAKRSFDKLGVAISARKEQVRILQTLVRATGALG